jgi:molecular chaperone DnaK (HSP70)
MIEKIVTYVYSEFENEIGIELPKDEMTKNRVYAACEKAYEELKKSDKTEINLPFICATENGPFHLLTVVSNDILNSANTGYLKKTNKEKNTENINMQYSTNLENVSQNDTKSFFEKIASKQNIIFLILVILSILIVIIWEKYKK